MIKDFIKDKLLKLSIKLEQKAQSLKNEAEEYNDIMDELEKAKEDYNYLTDNKIQKNIIDTGDLKTILQSIVFDFPTIFMLFFYCYITYAMYSPPEFEIIDYFKIYAGLIIAFGIICLILEIIIHSKCKKFAIENYKKTTAFTSKFIDVKEGFNFLTFSKCYYMYFEDENKKKVKCIIPEKEYHMILYNDLPKKVYVLKIPSISPGNKETFEYKAYIPERLENNSFLAEEK